MDVSLLGRGFDSADSDVDDDGRGSQLRQPPQPDDDRAESEDWADQELRELRMHVGCDEREREVGGATLTAPCSATPVMRRPTINGVDVAPRSELSPPIAADAAGGASDVPVSAPIFEPPAKPKKPLSLKFKQPSSAALLDSDEPQRKTGTLSRTLSRLSKKKAARRSSTFDALKDASMDKR